MKLVTLQTTTKIVKNKIINIALFWGQNIIKNNNKDI